MRRIKAAERRERELASKPPNWMTGRSGRRARQRIRRTTYYTGLWVQHRAARARPDPAVRFSTDLRFTVYAHWHGRCRIIGQQGGVATHTSHITSVRRPAPSSSRGAHRIAVPCSASSDVALKLAGSVPYIWFADEGAPAPRAKNRLLRAVELDRELSAAESAVAEAEAAAAATGIADLLRERKWQHSIIAIDRT